MQAGQAQDARSHHCRPFQTPALSSNVGDISRGNQQEKKSTCVTKVGKAVREDLPGCNSL